VSISPPKQSIQPTLPANFVPRMLSFDVYGTLINTPPANLDAFRTILVDAGRSDLDPTVFYSFWEQRNIAHYYESYRTYKDICLLSLQEAYEKFGVTAGREEAIQRSTIPSFFHS
jgi:2-haloacid dehalogenase